MNTKIHDALFSFNGVAIALASLGFLSGLAGLFFDVSTYISVKWLFLVVWVSLSLVCICIKLIIDILKERFIPQLSETPIRYLEDRQIFIIKRNENFLNNILVGCYIEHEGVDTLACVGVVHIVQEKLIQIKIHSVVDSANLIAVPNSLKSFVIRPVVPIDAVGHLTSHGNDDE